MDFSIDFLKDEERCGFYIPTAIKQAWAAGLKILYEIDRICSKYNITYYAEWGTLLGAIRHGGFVPWDDDLDISMKREDYIRFRQVADQELPKGYAIHDFERKEDHWLFLSRVVNSNTICFDKEHLDKFYNFPYIATVDIFVLDYLYKDEMEEEKRCQEIKYILVTADRIVRDGYIDEPGESRLNKLESEYAVTFNRKASPRELAISLYKLAEQQMARVKEQDAETIGQIFPWILKGGKGLPKRYYESTVDVPFENTMIKVPRAYDRVLSARYGDYFTIKKVWNGHDYPYFEGQRANLQAVADFDLPEFTFKKEMLEIHKKKESWKDTVRECQDAMEDLQSHLIRAIDNQDYDMALSLLPDCQQLAVDLGSYVEGVKGEHHPCVEQVVSILSDYCEKLYGLYESILGQKQDVDGKPCQNVFVLTKDALIGLLERREAVFLLADCSYFDAFKEIYQIEKQDNNTDVYVLSIPVMYKDVFGQIKDFVDVTEKLTGNIFDIDEKDIYDYREVDIELHHPDVIYIQNPYDGENPCLTMPSGFFAENLCRLTEQLVFVQSIPCDEFVEENTSDWYNMKHYVTAPGIVYADRIMVSSEHVRQQWIKRLVEFAGLETEDIWEEKLVVYPFIQKSELQKRDKKGILYCIGECEFTEDVDHALSMVEERLSILHEHNQNLELKVCLYPAVLEKREKLLLLLKKYGVDTWYVYNGQQNTKELVDSTDAYYGSCSPLVIEFCREKKPVMIAKS